LIENRSLSLGAAWHLRIITKLINQSTRQETYK